MDKWRFFCYGAWNNQILKSKNTVLEQYPLEKLSKLKKLGAYKHSGFWQCVDTIRDKEILEIAIKKKIYKWKKNFSCRWYGIHWLSCFKKYISKKYLLYSLSKNKPTKEKKIKNVKYLYSDITNYKNLKKNFQKILIM